MDRLVGIILCIAAVMIVIKSIIGDRGMSSIITWLAILLLFPGFLMAIGSANADTFLGALPIIGPVLEALGVISGSSAQGNWIVEFILTTQIACFVSITCWGADGFFENLVMNIIIAGASYLLLTLIKLAIGSVLPDWVDIGLITVMILLFVLLFTNGMLLAFLREVILVFILIGVLGALFASSITLVDVLTGLLSSVLVIAIVALGVVVLFFGFGRRR